VTDESNAEIALIGSCLCGEYKPLLTSLSMVQPEHLEAERNQEIYRAVVALHKAGRPVDAVTMSEVVPVGLRSEVFKIANLVPSALHVEYYADVVRRKHFERRFVSAAQSAISEPQNAALILALRQAMVDMDADGTDVKRIQDVLVPYLDVIINDRATQQARVHRFGFPTIDNALRAHPGMFLLVGARTSQGKTALLLRMAMHLLQKNVPVLFISAEMTAVELLDRMIAMESRSDLWKIRSHRVGEKEIMTQVTETCAKLHRLPLWIREGGKLTTNTIESDVESVRPEVVIVDYVQRMVPPARVESRAAYFSDVANGLKALAMNKKILVVAASQLNRELEHRKDSIPTLADLKESGGLEEAPDAVLLITPPTEETSDTRQLKILIAKNRNGPTLEVPFVLFKNCVRFEEMEGDALPGI